MSLSARIRSATPAYNNRGCRSCEWFTESITDETRQLINEWIDGKHSLMQLFAIVTERDDEDSDIEPLEVSYTAWRMHVKHHNERCRGDQ